ncbi:MAG: AAA family ATPase [Nitrososphaerota archaeon]|nr:AAA family ATPase [Candidatus Bathyarchaeota archaeon]MDW8049265.1 AAA family ATPase [Nitrososphaerota archaeon]
MIREIILENFMSYEYARIPLKRGVNIICGPNGAGKSSILLGISVALGQSYTERSKKLSDLIRWGKDIGRVTIVLDNSKKMGRRPVPRISKDYISLTRVLRRDGNYWFEIDNVHATRSEVLRLLSNFGIDPDNMLIIMHQDMAEQFVVLSSQEKLRLVESAAGIEPYRRNVLDAQKKLTRILSQEESLSKMLESAEQTLNYWRGQYDRYQLKKQLLLKRRFLERELRWAEVARAEEKLSQLENALRGKTDEMKEIDQAVERRVRDVEYLSMNLKEFKEKWLKLFEERLALERQRAYHEYCTVNSEKVFSELYDLVNIVKDKVKVNLEALSSTLERLKEFGHDAYASLSESSSEILKDLEKMSQLISARISGLQNSARSAQREASELETRIRDIIHSINDLDLKIEEIGSQIVDKRVELGILDFKRKELRKEINDINGMIESSKVQIVSLVSQADALGPKIAVLRSPEDILDEIRVLDGRIAAMEDVSEDVERMYESYSKLYFELKERAQITAENKERVLEEIRVRTDAWRKIIHDLLDHVNSEYQRILSQVNAAGFVQIINEHDIEAAGIEIHVGFKGSRPVPLNIYSQSGGERSTAVMAFLLALQRRVRSPFRAIDEYDVHMDPKNRETIANLLISSVGGGDAQYLAITPNQMFFQGKDVNIITVQNIEGSSFVKEVSG